MDQSLLHLLLAAILACLSVYGWRIWLATERAATLVVFVVLVGLTYDNAVLGLGRLLGHGPVLQALSLPRFILHATTTPLLIMVGFAAARTAGLRWSRRSWAAAAFWLLTAWMVVWGVITDLLLLELTPKSESGVVGYGNGEQTMPIPAVVTILALLAVGAVLWKQAGWPWLGLGAGVMLAASAAGSISALVTNLGELSLAVSLVATERRAGYWHPAPAPETAPRSLV